MSSVLVKGMDMPTECEYCALCRYYRDNGSVWCNAKNRVLLTHWEKPDWTHLDIRKPDWCPLVEVRTPHGDLIDRDELFIPALSSSHDNEMVGDIISDAPKVIEAEDGT